MKRLLLLLSTVWFTSHLYAIDAILVKTIDYAFKEKWSKTISESTSQIANCDTIFRNQNLYISTIASNFATKEGLLSKATFSIKITSPNNNLHFTQSNLIILNKSLNNKEIPQLADDFIKLNFTDKDPFGTYKIAITVTDLTSNETKTIESEIKLVELPSYKKIVVTDDSEFGKWFRNYNDKPTPEKALAYYIYYTKSTTGHDKETFFGIFSIFTEIFKNNTFLEAQVSQAYNEQDDETRPFLLYLLHFSNTGTKSFYKNLNSNDKNALAQIKDVTIPDMYGEITDPIQLDMLWATFMAGGTYQPMLKLIQTLDYAKYKGALTTYKDLNQLKLDREEAIYNFIYEVLLWSIKSNCNQNQLVKNYCSWAYQNEKLSPLQKEELGKILNDLKSNSITPQNGQLSTFDILEQGK